MPHMDAFLENAAGAECIGSFDMPSGYWQPPLPEECQDLHSLSTPGGMLTPAHWTEKRVHPFFNRQWRPSYMRRYAAEKHFLLPRRLPRMRFL